MPYSLQYGSDFHLKDNKTVAFEDLLKPVALDLALCGDIGDPFSTIYGDFIQWCAKRWQRVFVIAGNHEYFTDDKKIGIYETQSRIRTTCLAAGSNVHFLQKEVHLIEEEGIAVIGTTMWSVPDLRHWDKLCDSFIGTPGSRGEYNAIFMPDEYTGVSRPMHPSDITRISIEQSTWIRKTLRELEERGWRVIVLTHYLPTHDLNDARFTNHSLRSCYAVEMKDLFTKPVVAWICGHSHTARKLHYNTGVDVMLNPFGYKQDHGSNGYRANATHTV